VLAVGDAAFQKKCNDYFKTLKNDGKTVILVTHSMGNVRDYCNKAIVIENGEVIYEGKSEGAVVAYNDLFKSSNLPSDSKVSSDHVKAEVNVAIKQNDIKLNVSIDIEKAIKDPVIAVLFYRGGENVFRWVSDEELDNEIILKANDTYNLSMDVQNIFPVGKYYITVLVRNRNRTVDYGVFDNIASFTVTNETGFQHKVLWRPKVTYKGL